MTVDKAAQTALDERWERIAKAGSIEEMRQIIDSSNENKICDMGCPKSVACIIRHEDVREKISCHLNRIRFMFADSNNDLTLALTAAEAVCEQLRGIARGE